MLPDRVSNPGPLTYESGALPIALRGPARMTYEADSSVVLAELQVSLFRECNNLRPWGRPFSCSFSRSCYRSLLKYLSLSPRQCKNVMVIKVFIAIKYNTNFFDT